MKAGRSGAWAKALQRYWLAAVLLLAGCFAGEEPLPPQEALARTAKQIQAILDEQRTPASAPALPLEDAADENASEITFWFPTHPVYSRLVLNPRLAAAFNADHPGAALRATYIGDWYVAVQKLVVSLAAGGLPDIALVSRDWAARLAEAGRTADMKGLLPKAFIEDFQSSLREPLMLGGDLCALPADGFCSVLFYNRKYVAESAPATWAELERDARRLKGIMAGPEEQRYPIGDVPFIESLWSAGGDVCGEQGPGILEPEARETLDFILRLKNEGLAHPWALGNPETAFSLFLRGGVAMTVASSENAARAKGAPFEVGIAPVPGKTESISRWSDNVLVVFAKQNQAKRAALVEALKFLTGSELLSDSPARDGSAPIRASLAAELPPAPGLEEAGRRARAVPLMACWGAIELELNRYLELARRYEAPPAP